MGTAGRQSRDMSNWSDAEREARVVLHNAEEGDEVIWGSRKQPLTVTDVGGTEENEDHYLVVLGPQGGTYTIREHYFPTGVPDYRTEKGEDVTDIEIVSRAGADDDDDGGTQSGVINMPADDPDPPTDDQGRELGEEVGMKWPEPDEDAETVDADTFVTEKTQDPMMDYEALLQAAGKDPRDSGGVLPQTTDDGWTFVDELNAFGMDVPKSVGEWELIDYGYVTDSFARQLAWINKEDDELLALLGYKETNESAIEWNIYHEEGIGEREIEEVDPEFTTQDPHEAFRYAREVLYEGAQQVDMSVVYDDGDVKVVDGVDDRTLGQRVLERAGIDTNGVSPAQATVGWFGYAGDSLVNWMDENAETVGRMTKVAIIFAVGGITKRIFGVGITPVIEEDELGAEFDYKYKGDRVDWVNTSFDGKLTFDPGRFNLDEKESVVFGLDYDELRDAADESGFSEWQFRVPGADHFVEGFEHTTISEEVDVDDDDSRSRRSRRSSSSTSPKKASADEFIESAVDESGQLIAPHAEDEAGLEATLHELESLDRRAQREFIMARITKKSVDWLDDKNKDFQDIDQPKSLIGTPRKEWLRGHKDILSGFGFSKGDWREDFPLEVIVDAVERYTVEGTSDFEDAVAGALDEYKEAGEDESDEEESADEDATPGGQGRNTGKTDTGDGGDGGSTTEEDLDEILNKPWSDLTSDEKELLRANGLGKKEIREMAVEKDILDPEDVEIRKVMEGDVDPSHQAPEDVETAAEPIGPEERGEPYRNFAEFHNVDEEDLGDYDNTQYMG